MLIAAIVDNAVTVMDIVVAQAFVSILEDFNAQSINVVNFIKSPVVKTGLLTFMQGKTQTVSVSKCLQQIKLNILIMLKKILNVTGAQKLNKKEQQDINGGRSNCGGRACNYSGQRCYHNGHCGCPGECSSSPGGGFTCIAY